MRFNRISTNILDKLYPIYEKAEKYRYELKSSIHDYWADNLINLGKNQSLMIISLKLHILHLSIICHIKGLTSLVSGHSQNMH